MLNRLQGVFASFQKHDVKYVDILIEATPENSQRLLDALLDAGLGTAVLTTVEDLLSHEITIFRDKIRIDVQTETPGIRFAEAWEKRETMNYEGQSFFVVTREDLIASKLAAGRSVDLEDVRMLRISQDDEPDSLDE